MYIYLQLYQFESTLYYAEEKTSKDIDLTESRLILNDAAMLGIKGRQSSSQKDRDNTIAKTIVISLTKSLKNIIFCKLIVFV